MEKVVQLRNKCVSKSCDAHWKELNEAAPEDQDEPEYHICPKCSRSVCDLHSVTWVIIPTKLGKQIIKYEPAWCDHCAESIGDWWIGIEDDDDE